MHGGNRPGFLLSGHGKVLGYRKPSNTGSRVSMSS